MPTWIEVGFFLFLFFVKSGLGKFSRSDWHKQHNKCWNLGHWRCTGSKQAAWSHFLVPSDLVKWFVCLHTVFTVWLTGDESRMESAIHPKSAGICSSSLSFWMDGWMLRSWHFSFSQILKTRGICFVPNWHLNFPLSEWQDKDAQRCQHHAQNEEPTDVTSKSDFYTQHTSFFNKEVLQVNI